MKSKYSKIIIILLIFFFIGHVAIAQETTVDSENILEEQNIANDTQLKETYFIGEITEIIAENFEEYDEYLDPLAIFQEFEVKIKSGENKNQLIGVSHYKNQVDSVFERFQTRDKLILTKNNYSFENYQIISKYRSPIILKAILIILFLLFVLLYKKSWKIFASSIIILTILFTYTLPMAINNSNILLLSLFSAIIFIGIYTFINFGLNKKSIFSFLGNILTIFFSVIVFSIVIILYKPLGVISNISTSLYFSLIQELKLQNIFLLILTLAPIGFIIDSSQKTYNLLEEKFEKNKNNFLKYLKSTIVDKDISKILLGQLNSLIIIITVIFIPTYLHLFYATNITVPLWVKLNVENIPDLIILLLLLIFTIALNIPILSSFYYFIKKIKK